jgi:alpha-maltose-1-phosphate synthase
VPLPHKTNAVIRFHADGFDIGQSWLMGRQMAGHGFLRAAVKARGRGPLFGYGVSAQSAQAFATMVQKVDPAAEPVWIRAEQLHRIQEAGGVLYLAGPTLTPPARLRLRMGPAHYCLCGVTHTTAGAQTMEQIAELLTEPVMPWDALICTSTAVAETVRIVLEAQTEFLRWRLGDGVRLSKPEIPVIPLGVHCSDFAFSDEDKHLARNALAIQREDVAALYVGRIAFSGKAHPFQMYQGLQAAAARTRRRVVLILCGWAATERITEAFTTGCAQFAPDIRMILVDGRDSRARQNCWAAADLFISLSDGIQETFGLTPIEAMAAGLPVVVSDWNGYKDTIRDGVDGFRIPTWAPAPGEAGAMTATLQEVGSINYDGYLWAAAAATSIDMVALNDCLVHLVERSDLRKKLGGAGRKRVLNEFDWPKIFEQYQALWTDLNARRLAVESNSDELAWLKHAPNAAPSRLDPFAAFGHYPTAQIVPGTMVSLMPNATKKVYRERLAHILFFGVKAPERFAIPMMEVLRFGEETIASLGAKVGLAAAPAAIVIGTLAKMGIVRLR